MQLHVNLFFFVEYLPEDDRKDWTYTRLTTCLYKIVSNYSADVGIYMANLPYRIEHG
jgi:hypothetical protein